MPRGGPRPGGGRPKGTKDTKTRKSADRATAVAKATGKPLPLDVILMAMYDALDKKNLAAAASYAKDAAPYMHSKLAPLVAKSPEQQDDVPDGLRIVRCLPAAKEANGTNSPGA